MSVTPLKPRIAARDRKTHFDIFFSEFTATQLATEPDDFFFDAADAWVTKITSRLPDKTATVATWAELKEHLLDEVYKRRKKASAVLTHELVLGVNIGDAEFNDVKLAGEYLRAFAGKYETERALQVAVWLKIKEVGGLPVSFETIQRKAMDMDYNSRQEKVKKLKAKLAYDPTVPYAEAIARLEILLRPVLKNPARDLDTAAKVLYHFMWQVKRKLHDIPVEQHMGLIFLSPMKGNGKSNFVRRLCQPLRDAHHAFYAERKVSDFSVDNKIRNLVSNYVVALDELRGVKNGDLESFRTIMTSEAVPVRPLYFNDEDTVRSKFTVIGNANAETIGEIFDDLHGERRLFGLEVSEQGFKHQHASQADLTRLGHLSPEQLEKGYLFPFEGFKAEALWRLVDEQHPCQVPVDATRAHQAVHKPDNGVESFAHYYGLAPAHGSDTGGAHYPVKMMYQLYRTNQIKQGNQYKMLNAVEFGRELVGYLLDTFDGYNEGDVRVRVTFMGYRGTTCYQLQSNDTLKVAFNLGVHAGTLHPVNAKKSPF